MVACYALNGNGFEVISGLNGILSNVNASPGKLNAPNTAIHFKGLSNSYIEIANAGLLKSNSISFSGWVKPVPGFSSKGFIVFTKSSGSNNSEAYSLSFEDSPSGKKFRVRKGSNGNIVMAETSTLINLNNWYHVCFTIDTTAIKIYLNGGLQNTVSTSAPLSYHSSKSVYLGSTGDTTIHNPFTGDLDNVRFYNGVLTSNEVNNLYNSYSSCIPSVQPPIASFTLTQPFCLNTKVQATDLSGGVPDTWTWLAAGAIISHPYDIHPLITYSSTGNHTTSLIVSNSLGSDTAHAVTFINPLPVITAIASETTVAKGNHCTLTATGAVTYTWSTSQVGDTIIIQPLKSATYTVTGTDYFGCKNTATVRIQVVSVPGVSKHGIFYRISLYPNPTKKDLIVESEIEVKDYELFDLSGSKILNGALENKEVDISGLRDGVYFLRLFYNESSVTVKIIKQE
jgi:hypothetical protein